MQEQTLNLIGMYLKREFVVQDDLPYPLREALKRLAEAETQNGGSVTLNKPKEKQERG